MAVAVAAIGPGRHGYSARLRPWGIRLAYRAGDTCPTFLAHFLKRQFLRVLCGRCLGDLLETAR